MTAPVPFNRDWVRRPWDAPGMLFCEGHGGAMWLSSTNDRYVGLYQVGGRTWRLVPPMPQGLDALCDDLLRQFPGVEAVDGGAVGSVEGVRR